ncbi:MAG: 2-oxoglutarate dehydrogenase E1 component [Myxococcota bacterium]|jgi:2-oxoglutarate dehydrogenase E1 component
MDDFSQGLNTGSLAFVEALYEDFLRDPLSVEPQWREYFRTQTNGHDRQTVGPTFEARSVFNPARSRRRDNNPLDVAARQDKVDQLIRAYRVRGHMIAKLDPLGIEREAHPELELEHYELTQEDLDRSFSARTISGSQTLTLRTILGRLRNTYCQAIGVQFMHIDDLGIKEWLQTRMEDNGNQRRLDRAEQVRILTKLTDAEIFEDFLQKKFLGAKRFSLEGGETLIPLLDDLIEEAARQGIEEVIIGMAHRGRLNVLANITGKNASQIFREFDDADAERHIGSGDVKYHMGYSADILTSSDKKVHLSLCFNPSHLEFVDPVVIGRVRAKQDRMMDHDNERAMGILVHGDAAFAGEGVVQETLNMSGLPGYSVGGTIHVIVNNQIGFTTPPHLARSSPYATDVAKMLQIPIFHVNGEQPEAVAQVLKLAMDFRTAFKKDVVIDMYCYRRYGHNEGDDPAFTQPVMYSAIRQRKSVREGYIDALLELGTLTRDECNEIAVRRREHLEDELSKARKDTYQFEAPDAFGGVWDGYMGGADSECPEVPTSIPAAILTDISERLTTFPDDFTPHPKIRKLTNIRAKMGRGEQRFDWGAAEALAFGTILESGTRVRMSGQDVTRGTFSHRHAVLRNHETGGHYVPLCHLTDTQGEFEIWDSSLSENGPMGFEWGYSLDWPDALVLWEAQFGDFANAAQVIIDQFIVSSEDKWRRISGFVLLLPHGFEGQGPEHSSARLERYLMLAAEDNIQVVNLTTPAQYFHCLRRQVVRAWRKPLFVMAPKSLLRHPKATSTLEELANGEFHRILPDSGTAKPQTTRRVVMCSGKIYFELDTERQAHGHTDVAILRLEQIYPLAERDLFAALAPYGDDVEVVWVQEEPANNGAWQHLYCRFGATMLGHPLRAISRPESASPATGSARAHKIVQARLVERAFAKDE